jgi:GT2 family glycosyltransferase
VTVARPTFSVITPVFDPRIDDFEACVRSVRSQRSDDWEWVLADDASTRPEVRNRLAELESDPRIRVARLDTNVGIVGASNAAIALAEGEFLAFLDHDDVLVPHALEAVTSAIRSSSDVDFVYSDEAKIGPDGELYDWFAKPEWSPERLRGHNYCNHLSVMRSAVVRDVGGLRTGFDGAQDHDLVLRVTERARTIVHVPEVLYLWRAAPGSTAADPAAKPHATDAGCRAVRDHLARLGVDADVVAMRPGAYRSIRHLGEPPTVSIVIPTRGTVGRVRGRPVDLVVNAVRSIVERCEYPGVEFVVVHDPETPEATIARLSSIAGDSLVLVPWRSAFNFSAKVNEGVLRASGEVVILLNDDTEVVTPDWMETLVGLVMEPDVGMAGPMLLLADGRIQSAGHHYDPSPLHIGAGAPADDPGPNGMFAVAGERSGVTAACAAVRRATYLEVGGLSERFAGSYNDVDLGFKLIDAGYRIVWTPHARLHHFESLTRDPAETPEEAAELARRWGRRFGPDRYARQLDLWWAQVPMRPPVRAGGAP